MDYCSVIFFVLSSTLMAETIADTIKEVKDAKNVTAEAQNEEMLPWDYDAVSSNLSDHSTPDNTPEPTTEKVPTISITPSYKDDTRKSVEILDNNSEMIDSRRLFSWLKKFLHNDQNVTTTENFHKLHTPEEQTPEEPVAVAKVLNNAIINLTRAILQLTAILQINAQPIPQTPQMPLIPNNNVQVHRMLKKSYVFTPLANRRKKRDLTKTEKNETKEIDSKSGVHNSNGTNNATNKSIHKSLTPLSNDTILNNEVLLTNGTLKSNETLPSNDTSKSQAVQSSNDTHPTDINPNNMSKVQTRRNFNKNAIEKMFEETTRDIKTPQSEIKTKMLSYIKDTFTEIEKKIKRVKEMKRFVNSDYYKQGYLMANVDALETNAAFLKKDLDSHKEDWDEKTVLDAFDKVTVTSKTLNNLLESLDTIKWF